MADLIHRGPRHLTRRWGWPFNRFFDDLFEGFAEEPTRLPELWNEREFVPAIDVGEDDEALTVTVEAPGMSRDDLEVTVLDGVLVLRGEKKEEETSEGTGYHRVERRYGHFERRIRLPQYVDSENVEASYRDGVLRLRLPKREAARARTIQIQDD
ncbi:MAG: Hsp20/alpha crystallin family protein [Planctomycetota bacterium]|jgi:HSP20 family protein